MSTTSSRSIVGKCERSETRECTAEKNSRERNPMFFRVNLETLLPRLGWIHCKGIVHKDPRAGNIMMGRGEDANSVHIIDFWLAHEVATDDDGIDPSWRDDLQAFDRATWFHRIRLLLFVTACYLPHARGVKEYASRLPHCEKYRVQDPLRLWCWQTLRLAEHQLP